LITHLNRTTLLSRNAAAECREAARHLEVITAKTPKAASDVFVRSGLEQTPQGIRVSLWVKSLLTARENLKPAAAQLLAAAERRQATGFDDLRALLCEPPADTTLLRTCNESAADQEQGWRRAPDRKQALTRFGIATAAIGGAGTLAYLARNDDSGRVLAVATGVAAGAALGFATTAAAMPGGDTQGLGALLLGIPIGILAGIGGGVLGAKLSEEPGDARFAVTAVPLGLTWCVFAGETLSAW
jgi:hypothetical protein